MTEAELWQLLFMAIEASSGNFTIFGPYQRAVDFAAQLEAFQPGWTFMANRGLLYAGTTLIPLSVVVSLCFMYHVRRNPRLRSTAG